MHVIFLTSLQRYQLVISDPATIVTAAVVTDRPRHLNCAYFIKHTFEG